MEIHEAKLYEKTADRITHLIQTGSLAAGDRIPSVRDLSQQLKISVSTVLRAYIHLEERGVIEARPQSGYFVKRPDPGHFAEIATSRPPAQPVKLEASPTISDLVSSVFHAMGSPGIIPLGGATIHPDLLPVKSLNRAMSRALRASPSCALTYDALPGNLQLRQAIARRGSSLGAAIAPEGVVTTVGTMEAINLALGAICKPGDVVAIESPTYYGILQALAARGLRALELPTHPTHGLDLDALESRLKSRKISCLIVTPNFNNPLGSRMSEEAKQRLARLAARYETPVIEDDIYGDLQHREGRSPSLKSHDRKNWVMLCSSFSKTLAPGYRVGWIVPGPRFFDSIERLKFIHSIATPSITQITLADYLSTGAYDRWLRKLRLQLMNRLDWLGRAVLRSFPDGTRISRPEGGFVLWIEMPKSADSIELYRKALDHRIGMVPGPLFSNCDRYRNYLRLNAANPASEALERAVATLGRLAHEITP